MSRASDMFAAMVRRPPPPPPPPVYLLTDVVRKELRRLGLAEFRRTNYDQLRSCPKKLVLAASKYSQIMMPAHALCGSVFHLAVMDPEQAEGLSRVPSYYLSLFEQVRALDKTTRYHIKGQLLRWEDIKRLANAFASVDAIGITIGSLAARTAAELRVKGLEPIGVERRIELIDGPTAIRLTLYGTVDQDALFQGRRVKVDYKTTGLWAPFIGEDGQIKGQSMTMNEITFHPQLRYYDWLDYMLGLPTAEFFAVVFPANLIPYKDVKRAGEKRGEVVQVAPVPGAFIPADRHTFRASFGVDLLNLLSVFGDPSGRGQYRAMPSVFGKPECPSCPFFQPCLGSAAAARGTLAAQALSGADYDYLRDE